MYRLISQRYNKELNGAVSLARLAGSVMLHYYDLDYAVTEKANKATLESAIFTEVDGKVDSIVQNYFRQVWPEDQLLTEERMDKYLTSNEIIDWENPLVMEKAKALSQGWIINAKTA